MEPIDPPDQFLNVLRKMGNVGKMDARIQELEKQLQEAEDERVALMDRIHNLERGLGETYREISGAKKAERLSALITMAYWAKESVVDFMKYPL